jgi:hypothetical protein
MNVLDCPVADPEQLRADPVHEPRLHIHGLGHQRVVHLRRDGSE